MTEQGRNHHGWSAEMDRKAEALALDPVAYFEQLHREAEAGRLGARAGRAASRAALMVALAYDPDRDWTFLKRHAYRNRTTGAAEAQQTAGGAEKSQELTTTDDR